MIRIIIPVYNEEKNIENCIIKVAQVIKGQKYQFCIINDGSKDSSGSIINRLSQKFPIKLINHETNRGIAQVFRSGIIDMIKEGKTGDIIVIMEGDGTSNPQLLIPMIRSVINGGDIVIASRYKSGGGYLNFPIKRLFYSRLANMVFRIIFPSEKVKDYTIFYRAYSFKILKKVLQTYKDNLITSKYFVANTELLIKLMKLTKDIEEIPLMYDYGQKKGKSGLNIRKNLFQYLIFIFRDASERILRSITGESKF
ncbi:MAG: glycosyltransferase [Candidatus Levybacteria bacterium]|nr:glycosyltransferase [Candidatus Levybacteria bacterium]